MVMAREGILLVISGPSGVGKGTICSALKKEEPDLVYSISATTRTPRPGEVHGVDYFFYSRDQFEDMIRRGEFLEWASVYGNLYGTPRKYVQDALNQGKDVILEIDIQGARQIKENFSQQLGVFIAPPSMEELARRLRNRGTDSEEEIKRRLKLAEEEMKRISDYDYIIPNDDLEKAVEILKAILLAERFRTSRYKVEIPVFLKGGMSYS